MTDGLYVVYIQPISTITGVGPMVRCDAGNYEHT